MITLPKPLLAMSLLALFVAAGFAGGPDNAFDLGVMRRMAEWRAEWPRLARMAAGLTTLGGAAATLGFTGAASLWLLLRRAPARALLLTLTVLLERLLVEGLKGWSGRARPSFDVDWLPHSLAFPSGHAANSMTAFLAAAMFAAPPGLRRTAVISAVALAILVGLTRVILGVHWPSDVIGGWSLGLLTVGVALALGERSGPLRAEPQHQIVGRHRPPLDEDESA